MEFEGCRTSSNYLKLIELELKKWANLFAEVLTRHFQLLEHHLREIGLGV
jgi:hypothetical protein